MNPLNTQLSAHSDSLRDLRRRCVTNFRAISPRFRSPQNELREWLIEAHVRSGGAERSVIETLFSRYSASADRIAYRGHELMDFTHRRWNEMRLFGPARSDLAQKTEFFEESVNAVFQKLYPEGASAPSNIVHVTCTGYAAPSGAQRLVSQRGWGNQTQVVHAYHMGCYAAHPAIQIASGLLGQQKNQNGSVDVVHTELCSLHLDPAKHDPAQLVIQSLFADGFIQYELTSAGEAEKRSGQAYLEVLAARDEIVPDATEAMRWVTGAFNFTMELSKEVPTLFASALPRFASNLFAEADLDFAAEKPSVVFAIHPGGPRIIELSERLLGLSPQQTQWSHHVLREHGNMSSATLPHVWQRILDDETILDGSLVASFGAGPGLTLSGVLFRKRIAL